VSEPTTPVKRLTRRTAYLGQAVVVADRDDAPVAAGHLLAWGTRVLRLQTEAGWRELSTIGITVWTRA
jgi:hypothetical protein